jgi:TPR repeat protein
MLDRLTRYEPNSPKAYSAAPPPGEYRGGMLSASSQAAFENQRAEWRQGEAGAARERDTYLDAYWANWHRHVDPPPPTPFEIRMQKAKAGDARQMLMAGRDYEEGKVVAQDLKQAFAWYERAAKAGNPSGM